MTHSFPTRRSSDLYIVDTMVRILDEQLRYIRQHQRSIVGEVADAAENEGHAERSKTFLPGSVPGSPRHRRTLAARSEEHTSELQSLMRISYAVFCLTKKR